MSELHPGAPRLFPETGPHADHELVYIGKKGAWHCLECRRPTDADPAAGYRCWQLTEDGTPCGKRIYPERDELACAEHTRR